MVRRHLVLLPLLAALAAQDVRADGCFVWRKGADLNEPTQKAIIYWKDGREVMVLQVKYEGPAEDFAWIVPFPARPDVAAIDAEKSPFAEISLYTQRRNRWGMRGRGVDAAHGKQNVTVLERKIVGVYDVAVLAATDAGALTNWLNRNGYAFPAKRKDVLGHYTRKRWFYVAMRIDRKALDSNEVKKLRVGELQPIRFTFAAKEMVYPLKISSVNAGETEVLLYLLADAPMVLKGKTTRAGLVIEANLARAMTPRHTDPQYGTYRKAFGNELPLTWEALGLRRDAGLSLCKYRAVYKTSEMTDDLTFARFDPVPYWKERLRKAGDDVRQRRPALAVLACHDVDLLRKLANDNDEYTREVAAASCGPRTPENLLRALARDVHRGVRTELARNPRVPEGTSLELASDKDKRVRRTLAENPQAPRKALGVLAKDGEWEVRWSVARHPNVSADVLRQLAEDKSENVRHAVATGERTPADILWELADDGSEEVKRGVASNPGAPQRLLQKLASDRDPMVRSCVASNRGTEAKMLVQLSRDNDERVRWGAAWNESTPTKVLWKLARDESDDVRAAVTYNPKAPSDILGELAKDRNPRGRESVAGNLRTPAEALSLLAGDQDAAVRVKVASNTVTSAGVLEKLAQDSDWRVRYRVAFHKKTTEETLRRLAGDDNANVRVQAAQNPNTPVDVVMSLAKDRETSVSKAAKLALKRHGMNP